MKLTELETRKGQSSRKRYWARVEESDRERSRQADRSLAVCEWGVLSSIVLRGGESPLQGEGLDGST